MQRPCRGRIGRGLIAVACADRCASGVRCGSLPGERPRTVGISKVTLRNTARPIDDYFASTLQCAAGSSSSAPAWTWILAPRSLPRARSGAALAPLTTLLYVNIVFDKGAAGAALPESPAPDARAAGAPDLPTQNVDPWLLYGGMTMCDRRIVRRLAGTILLASLGLAWWVPPTWLLLTAVVGTGLLMSSFIGYCPIERVLGRFGVLGCSRRL